MGTMYEVDQSTGAVGDPVIGNGPIIGGNAIITKLWENPSPTSNFNAQTVEVDTSYDFYAITAENCNVAIIPKTTYGGRLMFVDGISGTPFYAQFRAAKVVSNGIAFEIGHQSTPSAVTDHANVAIPLIIYGIKLKEV